MSKDQTNHLFIYLLLLYIYFFWFWGLYLSFDSMLYIYLKKKNDYKGEISIVVVLGSIIQFMYFCHPSELLTPPRLRGTEMKPLSLMCKATAYYVPPIPA